MTSNNTYSNTFKSKKFPDSPTPADMQEIWNALYSDDLNLLNKRLSTLNLNSKILKTILGKLFFNSNEFSQLEEKFQMIIEYMNNKQKRGSQYDFRT